MQPIELNVKIGSSGTLHIPDEYRGVYGKYATVIISVIDDPITTGTRPGKDSIEEPVDFDNFLINTSGAWSEGDGLEYQKRMRSEWDRD